tara:strand:- start:590 stop:745 length:156 start_codon:yes stop_codon:yes gene_type:complete
MAELTKKQFKEKYGNTKVSFLGYNKFKFTFIGNIDDNNPLNIIFISVGGEA